MADNKATALKDTDYSLKLILQGDITRESKIIDISEPVKEALTVDDVLPSDSYADKGIARRLVGLWEESMNPNWMETAPMFTYTDDRYLLQDINRIIDAAIVNSKQAESVKALIAETFRNREDQRMVKIDHTLGEHYGFVTFPDQKK